MGFSVEHPIDSAPTSRKFETSDNGDRISPLENHLVEGERVMNCFVDGIVKQHRTVATSCVPTADGDGDGDGADKDSTSAPGLDPLRFRVVTRAGYQFDHAARRRCPKAQPLTRMAHPSNAVRGRQMGPIRPTARAPATFQAGIAMTRHRWSATTAHVCPRSARPLARLGPPNGPIESNNKIRLRPDVTYRSSRVRSPQPGPVNGRLGGPMR